MPAQNKGFTLVELLVVVAIIGILSAVGLVVFSNAQKAGRTAKIIQDLKAIQTALELYYSVNKSYPNPGGGWRGECDHPWGTANLATKDVIPGLEPTYMVAFPSQPQMSYGSCYLYKSDGTDYKLLAHTISGFSLSDYQSQRNLIDPARDGGPSDWVSSCDGFGDGDGIWSWAIYTDGARCW